MLVGVLRLELLLHAPGSLKEKRSIVQKLLARCRNSFPVSCGETGLHDKWQRAEFGFSLVGHDRDRIEATFADIEDEIIRSGQADICDRLAEVLHY